MKVVTSVVVGKCDQLFKTVPLLDEDVFNSVKEEETKQDLSLFIKRNALKNHSDECLSNKRALEESISLFAEKKKKNHFKTKCLPTRNIKK